MRAETTPVDAIGVTWPAFSGETERQGGASTGSPGATQPDAVELQPMRPKIVCKQGSKDSRATTTGLKTAHERMLLSYCEGA